MAATVAINRWTGPTGAPVKTPVDGIKTYMVTEDAHYAASGTNPVPVPSAGTNYSFWVSLRLSASVTPVTQINNIRFFTNSTSPYSAQITLLAQDASSYIQATGTVGSTGTVLNTTNHTGLTGAPVDPFTWTSAAPKTIPGSLANPATGDFGNWIVVQAAVTPGATGQVQADAGFTIQWDET